MRNCHPMSPPAPAPSLTHLQFLNGLSFSLSLSPVFCQAGRLVLWRQTKGRFSLGPVSRSPHRQHGSLGRMHQTWLDQKKNHTHTQASSQGDNGRWVKENWTKVHIPSPTNTPVPSKGTLCNIKEKNIIFHYARSCIFWWPDNLRKFSLSLSSLHMNSVERLPN